MVNDDYKTVIQKLPNDVIKMYTQLNVKHPTTVNIYRKLHPTHLTEKLRLLSKHKYLFNTKRCLQFVGRYLKRDSYQLQIGTRYSM